MAQVGAIEDKLIVVKKSASSSTQLLNLHRFVSRNMIMKKPRYHLESLAPELQIMIMTHLPTRRSVYNLIQASPQYYRVFLASKELILSTIVRQLLHPDVIPGAQAAALASRLPPGKFRVKLSSLSSTPTRNRDRRVQ